MKKCLNCNTTFSPTDKYCHACGQKTKIPELNFTNIVKDFFSNFFNFENKIWKTLTNIWVPGRLTAAYVAGKRNRYYNPIRIFLIVLFLFFTVFILKISDSLKETDEFSKVNEELLWTDKMKARYDSLAQIYPAPKDSILRTELFSSNEAGHTTANLSDEQLKEFRRIFLEERSPDPERNRQILDSLVEVGGFGYTLRGEDFTDSIEVAGISEDGQAWGGVLVGSVHTKDVYGLSPEELKAKHGEGKPILELLLVQGQKILKNLSSSLTFLIGNGTWAIILMVLSMALLFKLLYVRRGIKFAEHFVFHVYGHTRFLLIGLFFFLLSFLLPLGEYTGQFLLLWLLIGIVYMYKGMRAYYKQSRGKTFVKFLMTLFGFWVSMLLCSLMILFLSAVLL